MGLHPQPSSAKVPSRAKTAAAADPTAGLTPPSWVEKYGDGPVTGALPLHLGLLKASIGRVVERKAASTRAASSMTMRWTEERPLTVRSLPGNERDHARAVFQLQ